MYKVSAEDKTFITKNFPSWFMTSHGYMACDIPRVGRVYMHRVILERATGNPVPKHKRVDHINGDRLDNRRSNLRVVTPRENVLNKHTPPSGELGYFGVARIQNSQHYRAYIFDHGKQQSLGVYATPEEAAHAYNLAALKIRKDFARLNDVPACKLRPISHAVGASGFPGVRPHGNKWVARKKIKGKEYHVGSFATLEEAVAARQAFTVR